MTIRQPLQILLFHINNFFLKEMNVSQTTLFVIMLESIKNKAKAGVSLAIITNPWNRSIVT